jgi:hypothetical protein
MFSERVKAGAEAIIDHLRWNLQRGKTLASRALRPRLSISMTDDVYSKASRCAELMEAGFMRVNRGQAWAHRADEAVLMGFVDETVALAA